MLWRHLRGRGHFRDSSRRRELCEEGLLSASDETADSSDTEPETLTRRGPGAFVCDVLVPCSGSTQIHHACSRSGLVVSPPFRDGDSEWLHCSDVEFLDFLVWLLVDGRVNLVLLCASKTRSQRESADRLLRLTVLAAESWASRFTVSRSDECADIKSLTTHRRDGFQVSFVALPWSVAADLVTPRSLLGLALHCVGSAPTIVFSQRRRDLQPCSVSPKPLPFWSKPSVVVSG